MNQAKEVFSPEMISPRVFITDGAVRVLVSGLVGKDWISFRQVSERADRPSYERKGCTVAEPTANEIASAVAYTIGQCEPSIDGKQLSLIIPYAGKYLPIIHGNQSSGSLTITVEPIDTREFLPEELGIKPCRCVDVWRWTGNERLDGNDIEREYISSCGNVEWRHHHYEPSVPVKTVDDCGCCWLGYMFHPSEKREPDANVRVEDCNGRTIGWIFCCPAAGRTIPFQDCDGVIYGYLANRSLTAPSECFSCN